MNTKFKKEDCPKPVANGPPQQISTYVKDDFFDTMSCEALERKEKSADGSNGWNYAEQRKLDLGTRPTVAFRALAIKDSLVIVALAFSIVRMLMKGCHHPSPPPPLRCTQRHSTA